MLMGFMIFVLFFWESLIVERFFVMCLLWGSLVLFDFESCGVVFDDVLYNVEIVGVLVG